MAAKFPMLREEANYTIGLYQGWIIRSDEDDIADRLWEFYTVMRSLENSLQELTE
jgi:hypothetical protein